MDDETREKSAPVTSGDGAPDAIIIATGSEVEIALAAAEKLAAAGTNIRVVSMPCWELFQAQDQAYKDKVLPPQVKARLAIEAGTTLGWERWVGEREAVIGIDRFGASAPGGVIFEKLGITAEAVVEAARAVAIPAGVGWAHYEEGQENLAVLEGFVLLIFCLWLAKLFNRKAFRHENDL